MTANPPSRPLALLLVDSDPIFRLGLVTVLGDVADLPAIDQAATQDGALARLRQQRFDIVLVALNQDPDWLNFCQTLRTSYPNLPLLILGTAPSQQAAAQAVGAQGFCVKGIAVGELVGAIRQVAGGAIYWPQPAAPAVVRRANPLSRARHQGLQQIDEALAQVNRQLRRPGLPLIDWLYWSGRRRELRTARWLVQQLLPVEVLVIPETGPEPSRDRRDLPIPLARGLPAVFEETSPVILTLLEKTLEKIRLGVKNGTIIPLETDILRNAKKRELLYLVLNRFNTTLEEWRFLEISPAELPQRLPLALQEIWQVAALDFLGRNLNRPSSLSGDREMEWANLLLQNAGSIQAEVLAKIPFQEALFAYFLFERPLEIGKVFYPLGASENLDKGELLLQNLVITVANAVTQVILNQFWQSESLKQVLYAEPWLSAREIARFRNELSWRYRLETYWQDPKNIFESRYRLFFLDGDSIRTAYIYAPRQGELQQLQGLPWLATLALEARDAIAPRLQSLVDWAGRGVVYILTEVIGKAIGLIGRGIILGIGNVFQESRYRNPREQEREF